MRSESFEVGGLRFGEVPMMADDFLMGNTGGIRVAGLMGCTVLCELPFVLDYRASTFALGAGEPPLGTLDEVTIAVEVAGGGQGLYPTTDGELHPLALPTSRMLVDVEVEGMPMRMIVDTGASAVVLRSSIGAALVEDGRGSEERATVGMFGAATAQSYRLRRVEVEGVGVDGVVAMHLSTFDAFLDGIGAETGEPIDGVIGGTFLREFAVTVDYRARALRLARYESRDHVRDEGISTGALVDLSATVVRGGLDIVAVVPGTDAAAQGIEVGDHVVAVDGTRIDGLASWQVEQLLHGQLGQTRRIELDCPGGLSDCASGRGERELLVDYDALALP